MSADATKEAKAVPDRRRRQSIWMERCFRWSALSVAGDAEAALAEGGKICRPVYRPL